MCKTHKERIGIELAATRRSGGGLTGGWSMAAWEEIFEVIPRIVRRGSGIGFLIAGDTRGRP